MPRAVSAAILKLLGWRLLDPPGPRPAKAVVIAYPHTSNWDFPVTMLAKSALGLGAHWVGKDSLFRWPVAGLLRRLGGVPVNRRERTGFVEQMAQQFAAREHFLLALAPEGTRSLTAGWKTGFYRIARAARVPVALGCVDYARREVGILAFLELSGDEAADIDRIAEVYAGRRGLHPALAAPIRWLT